MTPDILAVIAGMAAMTYGVRAGGLLLASRLPSSGRAARWLQQIPAAVLASIVAPAIAAGGPAEAIGALATAITAMATKNLFAAMAAGVATVWSVRSGLGLG